MKTTAEKVAYFKGLVDATVFASEDKKKLFSVLADVLKSISEDIDVNAENIDNVDAHLLEVDEDLGYIEELVYGEEDPHGDYDECSEEDGFYDDYEESEDEDEDEDEDEFETLDGEENEVEDEMYEVECPACHKVIYLQESVILDGAVDCPNCGEPLEFDIEFEE